MGTNVKQLSTASNAAFEAEVKITFNNLFFLRC